MSVIVGVYVDSIIKWPTTIRCFKDGSCHMIADTLEELHAMARKIGLKRAWFQDTKTPHYDLTVSKRAMAVKLGAMQLSLRDFVEKKRSIHDR